MDPRFIAVAIPLFFVFIGIEYAVSRRRGLRVYRFADSIADLSCGITSQVAGVFFTLLIVPAYVAIHGHALWHLDGGAAWLVGFLGVDLLYYWWHRATHRINLLWPTHAQHHQSEDYNLAVALRQTLTSGLSSAPFYWVLAGIGVPLEIYLGCVAINTLYQFWVHTRLVGRLGPVEWVMNTPSHHRVHHGVDPWAIDKNYAGVFIVWDRMFGTFEPERREPVYGVVEGFRSWDPIWANLEPWVKLGRLMGEVRGFDKVKLLFAPPEWRPAGNAGIPEPTPGYRWDPPVPPGVVGPIVAWFAVVAVAVMFLIVRPVDRLSVGLAFAITASTMVWARMLTPRSAG